MNRNIAISQFKAVHEAHDRLLTQGHILQSGVDLHTVDEPQGYSESEFGQWLFNEDKYLSNFLWYFDVTYLYRESLDSYNVLFTNTIQTYNPITRSELPENLLDFEVKTKVFISKLDEIEQFLTDLDDDEFSSTVNQNINQPNPSSQSINPSGQDEDFIADDQANLINQLEKQNSEQLQTEKQRERDHLNEHLKNTQQSVEQMKQYYILKHYEMELEQHQGNKFESNSIQKQKKLLKELASIDQSLMDKTQTLSELEESDINFANVQTELSSNAIDLELMEDKKLSMSEDLHKLKVKQRLKSLDIEHLLKQLGTFKKELEEINSDKRTMQQEFDEHMLVLAEKQTQQGDTFKQQNQLQVRIELQREIESLEQASLKNTDNLKLVEIELQEFQQHNKFSIVEKQQELAQLDEQLDIKQQELTQLQDVNRDSSIQRTSQAQFIS
ncbi:MAG: hypothetical protein V3U71_13450 [Cocleimonas sp.]